LEASDIQSGTFAVARGGTGLSTAPSNGQLLVGNGTGYTLATLTAGTGITITNGVGSIQIDNSLPGFLNPMTNLGDTIYGAAAGAATRLAGNITTTRQFLRQTGTGTVSADPAWDTVTKTDVGLSNVENTALSTWAGSTNLTTLGTVTMGTWSATSIAPVNGGTGLTTAPAQDVIVYGGGSLSFSTLGPPSSGTNVLTWTSGIGITWTTKTTGTVTSVTGTSPVSVATGTTTPVISLSAAYGDTLNPYGSKTANSVLASPDGMAGVPSFRALTATDIPNLAASKITSGTLAVGRGGTGLSSYTVGDLLYASATTTLSTMAVVNTGVLYGTTTGPAYTAAADMAWDNTNKRLGIGTATPSYPLHVEKNQNATTYGLLYNSDAGTSARSVLLVESNTSSTGLYTYSSGYTTSGGQVQDGSALGAGGSGGLSLIAYNAAGAIRFYTSSTSAFRGGVNSSGLWGFGADAGSPTTLIYAARNQNASTSIAVSNTDTGMNASANVFLLTTATTGLELTSSGATNPNQLKLFSPLSGGVIVEASNASGFFALATGGTYPSSERFRIASNGNMTVDTNTLYVDAVNNRVGIGTTPSYRLHVSETYSGASAAFTAVFANSVSPAAANATVQYGVYNTLTINANVTGSARALFSILEHRGASSAGVLAAGMFGIDNNDAGTMGSTITHAVAVFARTPSQNAMGGTITNSYGLYVEAQSGTNITNPFGVYQAGSSDKNIFAGNVRIGSTTTPTNVLDVIQTTAGTAAVNMANSSSDPAANARYVLNNSATSGGLQIRSSAHATEPSDLVLYSSANSLRFYTNGNSRMFVSSTGNVVISTAALATSATDGFLYIPTMAGAPSGTPTAYTGRVPIVFNTTNNKIHVYDGGWLATAALT
jgi:hypothetical protein